MGRGSGLGLPPRPPTSFFFAITFQSHHCQSVLEPIWTHCTPLLLIIDPVQGLSSEPTLKLHYTGWNHWLHPCFHSLDLQLPYWKRGTSQPFPRTVIFCMPQLAKTCECSKAIRARDPQMSLMASLGCNKDQEPQVSLTLIRDLEGSHFQLSLRVDSEHCPRE